MGQDYEDEKQQQELIHESHEESPTSKLDDILLEKLEAAFHHETSTVIYHDLAKIASEHTPIDLAYAGHPRTDRRPSNIE